MSSIDIIKYWPYYLAGALLFVGYFLSILTSNPISSYLVVLISGFIAGRIFYLKRQKEPIFYIILIISGFILGYFIGVVHTNVSRGAIFIVFIGSTILSYYLHLKKILGIFKNERFLK